MTNNLSTNTAMVIAALNSLFEMDKSHYYLQEGYYY